MFLIKQFFLYISKNTDASISNNEQLFSKGDKRFQAIFIPPKVKSDLANLT